MLARIDAIGAELVRDGTLGADTITVTVLGPCGLSKAEAAHAASYTPGSVVTFRQGNRDARLSRGRAYRVEAVDAVDAEAGTVSLVSPQGKRVAWSPARWGGDQAEAYTEAQAEFRTGDRLQFTPNNGNTAEVVAIDAEHGRVVVAKQDGKRQTLDLGKLADRHVRHGWVRTIHSSQGATCDRVMAHLESFRANTVDAASVYVAISRAKTSAAVYTDSRASLTEALGLRGGAQVGADRCNWIGRSACLKNKQWPEGIYHSERYRGGVDAIFVYFYGFGFWPIRFLVLPDFKASATREI